MSTTILTSAGVHNFQVLSIFSALVVFGVYLGIRVFRLSQALVALRVRGKAIAFLPGLGNIALELRDVFQVHVQEVIRLFQQIPTTYSLNNVTVGGHTDNVKWTAPESLEVDIIGSGECLVLIGVDVSALKSLRGVQDGVEASWYPLLSYDRIESLKRGAFAYSRSTQVHREEKLTFNIPDMTQVDSGMILEACLDSSERVPVVVFLSTPSHVEITLLSSKFGNGPVSHQQFLISYTSSECIQILPIFPQNMDECMVCYENASNTVILSCRHVCICTQCILRLRDSTCIVCRQHFSQYLFIPPHPTLSQSNVLV